MSKENKKKKKRIWFDLIFVISLLCFLGSGIYLVRYFYIVHRSQKNVDVLKDQMMVEDTATDDFEDESGDVADPKSDDGKLRRSFDKLLAQNSDIVGWIQIEETSIDYPVMQTPSDNEFYLHRNFNKAYEFSGLPFVDARCDVKKPSENLIIYGHHMNTDTMFTAVHEYKKKAFFEEHPIIQFDTIYGQGDYQICYVILSKAYEEETTAFQYYDFIECKDEKEFEYTKKSLEKLSIYDTGETITREDQLITLSTCEYSQDNGRMAIIAKKIR